MTTSATSVPAAATSFASAPWMRAVVLNQAIAAGWKFTQLTTTTDQYTKGTKLLVVSWGSVVTKALHQENPKVSPKVLGGGHANKLQIITNWIGFKAMGVTSKWTPAHLVDSKGNKVSKDELTKQALSTFKVMSEAKA